MTESIDSHHEVVLGSARIRKYCLCSKADGINKVANNIYIYILLVSQFWIFQILLANPKLRFHNFYSGRGVLRRDHSFLLPTFKTRPRGAAAFFIS